MLKRTLRYTLLFLGLCTWYYACFFFAGGAGGVVAEGAEGAITDGSGVAITGSARATEATTTGAGAAVWGWSVTEVPVTLSAGTQMTPALDGTTAVFRDYSRTNAGELVKKEIFSGAEAEFAGPGIEAGPGADSGAAAWQDLSSLVCAKTLDGEGEKKCVASAGATSLALSGARAITESGTTSTITLIDFDAAKSNKLDSSTLPGMRYDPDIEGGLAVWVRERGYAGRYYEPLLVAYDIESGAWYYLTKTGGGANKYSRNNPTISNGRVLYQQKINEEGQQWDICEAIPETFGVSVVTAPGDQMNPSLSGNLLVYQDNRGGYYDEAGRWVNAWDIYLKDLETGIEQPVSTAPGEQKNPVINGNIVLWEDNRHGNWDIYAAVLSPAAADEQLLESYSPLLVMHRDEDFRPVDAGVMVAAPGTVLMDGGVERLRAPDTLTLDAIGDYGTSAFIDLPGHCITCGFHLPDPDFDRYVRAAYLRPYRDVMSGGSHQEAVYGRVVRQGDRTVIQYWLNYYFNSHPMLGHEGDWELVEVELNGDLKPLRVSLSQHGYGSMRLWQDVETADGHPVVYVARGSHANYFESGSHSVELGGVPSPLVIDETDSYSGTRTVRPQVIPLPGSVMDVAGYRWLGFAGRWGEVNGMPGGDPPYGPAWSGDRWNSPFAWDGLGWDGAGGLKGKLVGLQITAGSAIDIDLYDSLGRHVGKDGAGVMGTGISGLQTIHFPSSAGDRQVIMVPNGAGSPLEYLLELSAPEAVNTPVTVTYFDPVSGSAIDAGFGEVAVGGGATATLRVWPNASPEDLLLLLDADGDGVTDIELTPQQLETAWTDITAPGAVRDLTVEHAGDGTARLRWTAPGDDGAERTATAYLVRYGAEPINEDNWSLAESVSVVERPLPAGALETLEVPDLPAGSARYFAVRTVDEAGNFSPLSNIASVPPPQLGLWVSQAVWESYAAYLARELTVWYRVTNSGMGAAYGFTVREIVVVPGEVNVMDSQEVSAGVIDPEKSVEFKVRFSVPAGVERFVTAIYASCRDGSGAEMWYPEPPPGNGPS